MSDRFETLLPRALDSALDGAEEIEFVRLLDDPRHAERFAELTRLDRELAGLVAAPVADDTLERLVYRDLDRGPERGHTTRILAVMDRVRTRRVTRRQRRSSQPGQSFWWAAAALFAAALLIAVLGPTPARPRKETVRVALPPEPDPVPPQPEIPRPAPRPERAPEPLVVPPTVQPKSETPAPLEPAPPAPPQPPRTPSPTVVSVARVERVEGQVSVREGQELLAGHDLDTGADGLIVLKLPDATQVEVHPGSQLRGLSGAAEEKRFTLQKGRVSAEVSPRARPFVFQTPDADVAVLGTRFSVSLVPGLTRLDVDRGRVKLARRGDGASAEVGAGQSAVVGPGIRPVSRPCPAGAPMVVSFTMIDVDTGRPVAGFDPVPEDAVFTLSALPRFNLRANLLPGTPGSVVFAFDGDPKFNLQNGPPFAAYAQGDKGRWQAWSPAPGTHTLTATPYLAARGTGGPGGALTLSFKVR